MANSQKSLPRIVIVGGGAGGIEFAAELGKKLAKKQQANITLIDKKLTHLWKPLLHEVAAGTLNSHEDEVSYLGHANQHHYQFELGEMIGLDRNERAVILAPIYDENQQEIVPSRRVYYDILVLALGGVSNDFGVPGVKEYCAFLDSREQADQFQQLFLNHLMQAQYQQSPLLPGQLDVAIIGAGATGVELAAELHYSIEQAIYYGIKPIQNVNDVKITLIESGDRILAQLPERLSRIVTVELQRLNVKVLTHERVTEITNDGIYTANGKYLAANLKVWAAGVKAADFLQGIAGLETNRANQLLVAPTLQTTVDENIFAFGDCASCPQPGKTSPVPPRAQAAHQQALFLAKSLTRKLQGKRLLPFIYHDYGSLISLSRHGALGSLMGRALPRVMIEGKLARLTYILLYKRHQVALFGWWRVILLTLSNLLTRRIKPTLKLH